MRPDRPSTRPALPAAVSSLVHDLVHGPPVVAVVVAAHRYALYLSVRGSVIPVVTADAVALPTALRLAVPSTSASLPQGRGWGVSAGDEVVVGDGRVVLPDLDVVASRTWRPARVRRVDPRVGCSNGRPGSHLSTRREPDAVLGLLTSGATSGATSAAGAGSGWLADGIRAACGAVGCSNGRSGSHLGTRLGEEPSTAVRGLVGRGAGLTPSGDDALAGALLVAAALGTGTTLADAVRARLGATTAVSAALLDAAADGYAARPVVTLVDAAVVGDAATVGRALPAVLAIGHTSGADTVTGIRAALESLIPRPECGSGCQGDHFRTHGEGTRSGGRAA